MTEEFGNIHVSLRIDVCMDCVKRQLDLVPPELGFDTQRYNTGSSGIELHTLRFND
jgi:hypothetical protein